MGDTGAPIAIKMNDKLVNGLITCFVYYDLWSASGHQVKKKIIPFFFWSARSEIPKSHMEKSFT
jgi:hypothetical protein